MLKKNSFSDSAMKQNKTQLTTVCQPKIRRKVILLAHSRCLLRYKYNWEIHSVEMAQMQI